MRLFFEKKDLKNNTLKLTVDRFHYLSRVKRLQKGETLSIIIDQICYTLKVIKFDQHHLYFNTLNQSAIDTPPLVNTTLIQCLPKQDKMDDIINNCTQLGIQSVYPVESHRSIVKWDTQKKDKKRHRWQLISQQSSEQSYQVSCPEIHPIQSLSSFCTSFNATQYDTCIIPWESEESQSLKSHLSQMRQSPPLSIAFFIGPEGGISTEEIIKLQSSGFISVSLGDAIYRTEIAGLVTLSQLIYHFSLIL
jgi:16S rRNA (uracil1498-N3)-methyltransferase